MNNYETGHGGKVKFLRFGRGLHPRAIREYRGYGVRCKSSRPAHMPGDLIPPSSVRSDRLPSPEFREGWEAWWAGLTVSPPGTEPGGPAGYARDEYTALNRWPRLRDTVLGALPNADRWHQTRKSTALNDWQPDLLLLETVKAVEASLGQKLSPFRIDILLSPIRTTEICEVSPADSCCPNFNERNIPSL